MNFLQYLADRIRHYKRFCCVWVLVEICGLLLGLALDGFLAGLVCMLCAPVTILPIYIAGYMIKDLFTEVRDNYENWKTEKVREACR